jgi:hypothetical protein
MAMLKGKPVQLKNAVMMLNEMFPPPRAPQYKVTSQTGPPNNPTFSMVCCIQDKQFPGEGIYSGFFLLNFKCHTNFSNFIFVRNPQLLNKILPQYGLSQSE